ncbi:cathepsin L-like [Hemiscyllium ocellatum]|uniref:cathepsin L-like n=1 Tax=Hemiscyllium ocellatum TaxID=170820 RepID=UPI0029660020|nr:cathepsin L-like [Hemiscyllium ocellatum]
MFQLAVTCLALSSCVYLAAANTIDTALHIDDEAAMRAQFEDFKVKYKKQYDNEEEERRFRIFVENLKDAKRMQGEDQGTAMYGMNKFSDMSDEEFEMFYLNPMMSENNSSWPEEYTWREGDERLENLSCPRKFDWRRKGAVTRVKNQGRCGSCWAFGVVANIESVWYIRRRRLVSLSEQQLLDCDSWDRGCKGGYPFNAFNSILKLGGLMCWRNYRYRASRGPCRLVKSRVSATIQTYRSIRPHEDEMRVWVAHRSPIVVSINAAALKGYRHGVIRPKFGRCRSNRLNHVVLVVGYGQCGRHRYWIIKNSWGVNWGEQGYFRLYRGENACGINQHPCTCVI